MNLAIISDTHLGDAASFLAPSKHFTPTALYQKLKSEIFSFTGESPLDYLILNGDIMDFSINSFDDSIRIARPFFQQLERERLAKEIIYIPGNHDKQIWDAVQWDTSIIGNLMEYRDPDPFKRIQAGVIDLAANTPMILDGVQTSPGGHYGEFFMKGLFADANHTLPVIVVYPNLYVKTSHETILITHGHMVEFAWIVLSELLSGVAGIPANPGLKELEEWNVPLTTLICTGVGQAGKVSELFYQIEREAYSNKSTTLKKVLRAIIPKVDNWLTLEWYLESLDNIALKKLAGYLLSVAQNTESPREIDDYFQSNERRKRFTAFYRASVREMKRLGLNEPSAVIFGHTHHPHPASQPQRIKGIKRVRFFNTGGWLKDHTAELFLLDNTRFTSVRIN